MKASSDFGSQGGLANGSRERAPDDRLRVIRRDTGGIGGLRFANPPYGFCLGRNCRADSTNLPDGLVTDEFLQMA
jgi:hypothetical protein